MNFFQKPLILALGAILVFSCSKDQLPVVDPNDNSSAINQISSAIADFKVIFPKGNQIIADGVDAAAYEFLFYDKSGNLINDKLPNVTDIIGKVDVDGQLMYMPNAVKSSKLGTYNIKITANKITKVYPIVATTADKKIVEIPIIFNFVSTDYSDKVVELTFTNLVNTYKRTGIDNVVFKLAEIDNEGKPLLRKGVKFWDYKGVATDQMDFKTLWGNKFAFDVYLIDNKTIPGASAYANHDHIVIDNINMKKQYENANSDANPSKVGMFVLNHEMGHVLGLAHVYRDDNNCQVQDGVNDIQAVSSDPKKREYDYKTNTWTTICGGKQLASNLMGYGGTEEKYITRDQLKIAKKTALSLKF